MQWYNTNGPYATTIPGPTNSALGTAAPPKSEAKLPCRNGNTVVYVSSPDERVKLTYLQGL